MEGPGKKRGRSEGGIEGMSDRKSGGRVQVEEGRQKGWVDGFVEEKWGKGEGRERMDGQEREEKTDRGGED